MQSTKYCSTRYTNNFARLCRLVTVCADLLRNLLEHFIPKVTLRHDIKVAKEKIKKALNSSQQHRLFNKEKLFDAWYDDLDIAILYVLLRNLCDENAPKQNKQQKRMKPPLNGWGKTPTQEDRSLAANIERIRLFRNDMFHRQGDSVADNDFKKIWDEMKNAVEEIEKELKNKLNSTKYVDTLEEILVMPMDSEMSKKYIKERERMRIYQESLEEKIHESSRRCQKSPGIESRIVVLNHCILSIINMK